MIQQPIQQPFCDRTSQYSDNGAKNPWLGHGVAVSKAFVVSMIPMEDPCFSINPRKALLDLGKLAAATILPWSTILFMVKDIADACSGSRLPGQDVKPESPQKSKETRKEAQEKEPYPKDGTLQPLSTPRYQGSQGTKGLLVLGTLASSIQYAHSTSIADGSNTIEINDAKTLSKIGLDPNYPLDGKYQQVSDIDVNQQHQSIGNRTHPFTGHYDGQCHTISNLSDCFVEKLDQGSISNLRFTHANITSENTAGLVACTVNGTVSDIWADNVLISTSGDKAYAGIGGGGLNQEER